MYSAKLESRPIPDWTIGHSGIPLWTKKKSIKIMIETGGFLGITSEIGIESQQTWYLWTPWAKWSSTVLFVSGPGLMLRFGVPPRKFDFFRNRKSET